MAKKLKFGKRIKNAFRKQSSGSSLSAHDGDDESSADSANNGNGGISISQSDESNTGSLNSDVRTHGPIDVDTCRKHTKKNKRRNSKHAQRTNNGLHISSGMVEGLSKIVESPSAASSRANSRASTPETTATGGSSRASRPLSCPPQQQHSPGAQSLSTINGRDVFERSRSATSQKSTGATQPSTSSQGKIPRTTTPTRSMTSWLDAQTRVLLSHRSSTPVSSSTAPELSHASSLFPSTPSNKAKQPTKAATKASPTSVIHVFGYAIPMEIDPVESLENESIDKYSIEEPDRYEPGSQLDQDYVQSLLGLPPKNYPSQQQQAPLSNKRQDEPSSSSPTNTTALVPPPKISRMSPAKMFNDACKSFKSSTATAWDPSNYTNLEDAIAEHATMLAIAGAKKQDKDSSIGIVSTRKKTGELSDAASVSTGSGTSSNNNKEEKKNEFLALKKDTEKNEFKKVVLNKKNDAPPASNKDFTKMTFSAGEPQEMIEIQAKNLNDVLKKKIQEILKKKTQEKDVVAKQQPTLPKNDPPGLDATNTRSVSPTTPASPNPFVEDVLGSSTTTPPQHPVPSQLQLTSDILVDIIPSFSFDQQEAGCSNSLSDDSCSYLSELESIGDITICEETTRLIEARCLYENDAKTNVHHPSRLKKSIMKVGSKFKKKTSIEDMMRASVRSVRTGTSPPSVRTEIIAQTTDTTLSIYTEQRRNLTWYDDEENWNKPFTLRTDESFDASTVTSGKGLTSGVERVVRINPLDQFLGDFIKGIGKYAVCGGGEDDVVSFDVAEQQEI